MKKLSCLIVSILVFIFFIILAVFAFRNDWIHLGNRDGAASTKTSSEEKWDIPCQSNSGAAITNTIEGYDIRVYVAEIPEGYLSYSMLESSDQRTLSIEDLNKEEPTIGVFVNLETTDYSSKLLDTEFELCNEDNMTNHLFDGYQLDEEIAGSTSYLHGSSSYIPSEPGNYRFDGYINVDGQSYLAGQLDLVFTE